MFRLFYKFSFVYLMAVLTVPTVLANEFDIANTFGANSTNIGIAAITVNTVTGTIENQTVNLNNSDAIFQNEVIETKANSTTQFMFLDETILTVGPESRLVLDEILFDPNATEGKLVLSAMKGLFSFVSGSLPSESYEVKTPTATIGVRGTRFNLYVARNGASTVVLKSGAVDVKNLRGVTRRISKVGLATRVSTKQSSPTIPNLPSADLIELFVPLGNPNVLKGKNPNEINYTRESVEEKNIKIQKELLKKESQDVEKNKKLTKKSKKQLAQEKKSKRATLAKEKKEAALEKKSKKATLAKEKKAAKLEKKINKTKLSKKVVRKNLTDSPLLINKKAPKKLKKKKKIALPKTLKSSGKKAVNAAKISSKLATKTVKATSKMAKTSSKKAAMTAKTSSKVAKAASKKAAKTAKMASKVAKAASKKAAKTAKAAVKKAKGVAKKAVRRAKADAKKAKAAAKKQRRLENQSLN